MADNTKEDDKEVPKSNKKLILLGLVGLLVVGGSARWRRLLLRHQERGSNGDRQCRQRRRN